MKWNLDNSAFRGSMSILRSETCSIHVSYLGFPGFLNRCKIEAEILALLNGQNPPNQTEPANEGAPDKFPYWAQTAATKILNEFCHPERHRYEEGITAKCMGMILEAMPKQTFKGVNITDLLDEAEKRGYERGLAERDPIVTSDLNDFDLIKEHDETIRKLQEQILAQNEMIRKLTT